MVEFGLLVLASMAGTLAMLAFIHTIAYVVERRRSERRRGDGG